MSFIRRQWCHLVLDYKLRHGLQHLHPSSQAQVSGDRTLHLYRMIYLHNGSIILKLSGLARNYQEDKALTR